VKSGKTKDWNRQNGDESHETHSNNWLRMIKFIFAIEDVKQTERKDAEHVNGECDQEEEKESVIPSSNAI
jgi:hypothetical protein